MVPAVAVMSTADLLVAYTWLLRSPSGFLSPPSGTCTHLYLRKQITHLSLLGIIVFFAESANTDP